MLTKLVGTGHRPIEAQQRAMELRQGEEVYLVPDPENEFDSNAIKILSDDDVFMGFVAARDYKNEGLLLAADLVEIVEDVVAIVGDGAGTKSPYIEIETKAQDAAA